jgi:acetoin utilization protein AcuB
MRAKDAMTREVIWIEPTDDLSLAWGLMSKLSIRHLPVMDGGRLVGILSDRDVLVFASVRNGMLEVPELAVSEAMTRDVVTCGLDATIAYIGERMLRSKIDSMPILGPDGSLAGLVTSSDLIQLLVDREWALHEPLPFDFELRNGLRSPEGAA